MSVEDLPRKEDNSKLCSCGGDRQIFYWVVATGSVIRKFGCHDGEVRYPSSPCIIIFHSPFFFINFSHFLFE
ncbi:WD repeat domain-containing protein 83 [Spatholobus suberectus]|nr:WD repeat domain-containing protein 83 [Spatholobus suberectus]